MNMSIQPTSAHHTTAAEGAGSAKTLDEILPLLKELLSALKSFLADKIEQSGASDPTKEAAQQGAEEAYGPEGAGADEEGPSAGAEGGDAAGDSEQAGHSCGGKEPGGASGAGDDSAGASGADGGSTTSGPTGDPTSDTTYGAGETPEGFPVNLPGQQPSSARLSEDEGDTEIMGGNYPDTAEAATAAGENRMQQSKKNPSINPLPADMAYRDEIFAAAKTYGIDPVLLGKMAYRESSLTPGLNSAEGDPAAGYVRGLLQSNDAGEGQQFTSSNQALNEALNGARQLRGEINAAVSEQGLSGEQALQKAMNFYNTGDFSSSWADFSTQNGAQSEGHAEYWQWIADMKLTSGMDHDNGS